MRTATSPTTNRRSVAVGSASILTALLAVLLSAFTVGCTNSDASSPTTESATQSLATTVEEQSSDSDQDTESRSDNESDESTASLPNASLPNASLPNAMRVDENPGVDVGTNWLGVDFMSETQVDLVWSEVENASSYQLHREPIGVDVMAVVLDQSNLIYRGSDNVHSDRTVEPDLFYVYILVVDIDGEPSARRWSEALTTNDTTPPTPITGLTGKRSGDTIELSWNPSSDEVEFASYSVSLVNDDDSLTYIGGGTEPAQSSFIDDKPSNGVNTYEVVAVDFHNNRTEPARIEVE